jgi:hypothetical protein
MTYYIYVLDAYDAKDNYLGTRLVSGRTMCEAMDKIASHFPTHEYMKEYYKTEVIL